MAKYDQVGGGSYRVFKKRKGSPWPTMLGVGFILLLIIGAASG